MAKAIRDAPALNRDVSFLLLDMIARRGRVGFNPVLLLLCILLDIRD
jgi:hypothetical protein